MPAVYAVAMRKTHRPAAAATLLPPNRPRHFAAAIMALPTRDERRAALVNVPEPFRDWVAFYVRDLFEKRRCLKRG